MGSWTYERSAAAADVPLEASGCAVACWHSISGASASPIPVNRSCDRSSSHPHTGQMAYEPGPSSNTKYPQHGQGYRSGLLIHLLMVLSELPTRRFGRRVLVLVVPFLAMLGEEPVEPGAGGQTDGDGDAS